MFKAQFIDEKKTFYCVSKFVKIEVCLFCSIGCHELRVLIVQVIGKNLSKYDSLKSLFLISTCPKLKWQKSLIPFCSSCRQFESGTRIPSSNSFVEISCACSLLVAPDLEGGDWKPAQLMGTVVPYFSPHFNVLVCIVAYNQEPSCCADIPNFLECCCAEWTLQRWKVM